MPNMPRSYVLGQLPTPPALEPTALPPKPSRVREFLAKYKIRPHPTKRSVGLLPDGTEMPLSPSQIRELAIMNTTPEAEAPSTPLVPVPVSQLDRIEAKLDLLLAALRR